MYGVIYYIDYMQDGNKQGNLGFIKINDREFFCSLHSVPMQCGNRMTVYGVNTKGEKVPLVEIPVRRGRGQIQGRWDRNLMHEDCSAIFIPLYANCYGRCMIKPYHKELESAQQQTRSDSFIEELIPLEQNKWEQICKMYPQVHVFPDAQCIVIKPKDLLILTEEYQDMATNSFVLHAYYNYRQLLLIRYIDSREYYIGVPGSYLEREKRVAILFGFESFENGEAYAQEQGKVYQGCFGYYLKRVAI